MKPYYLFCADRYPETPPIRFGEVSRVGDGWVTIVSYAEPKEVVCRLGPYDSAQEAKRAARAVHKTDPTLLGNVFQLGDQWFAEIYRVTFETQWVNWSHCLGRFATFSEAVRAAFGNKGAKGSASLP